MLQAHAHALPHPWRSCHPWQPSTALSIDRRPVCVSACVLSLVRNGENLPMLARLLNWQSGKREGRHTLSSRYHACSVVERASAAASGIAASRTEERIALTAARQCEPRPQPHKRGESWPCQLSVVQLGVQTDEGDEDRSAGANAAQQFAEEGSKVPSGRVCESGWRAGREPKCQQRALRAWRCASAVKVKLGASTAGQCVRTFPRGLCGRVAHATRDRSLTRHFLAGTALVRIRKKKKMKSTSKGPPSSFLCGRTGLAVAAVCVRSEDGLGKHVARIEQSHCHHPWSPF